MSNFDKNIIQEKNPWLEHLTIIEETDSTQKEAKKAEKNSLIITDRQRATYGRFGRSYFAADKGGIYMSANLGPIDFEHPIQYTLLAASAVVKAIENLTNKKASIKWVNDIYLDDKKIVGILAESGPFGIVLGMGINFHIQNFPEAIANRAASLFSADELPNITESDLIAEIWKNFTDLKDQDFMKIYREHCFILGMTVSFEESGQAFEGKAVGLTEQGELQVQLDNGNIKQLNSGEISLKNWQ